MRLIYEFRTRARYIFGPVLGICAIVYFAYHAVQGDRGLLALYTLERDVAEARDMLDTTTREREWLEHRVALLHPGSLDPDMLDERARLMLNVANTYEIVVMFDDTRDMTGIVGAVPPKPTPNLPVRRPASPATTAETVKLSSSAR